MLDVKRRKAFMKAMQKEKIYVGRAWPPCRHIRALIGTREEMASFKTALLTSMNRPGADGEKTAGKNTRDTTLVQNQ